MARRCPEGAASTPLSRAASVCKTLASGGESAVLARLKRDTRAVLTPQSCARTHSVLYARVRERTSTGGNQALRLDSVQRKALPQQSPHTPCAVLRTSGRSSAALKPVYAATYAIQLWCGTQRSATEDEFTKKPAKPAQSAQVQLDARPGQRRRRRQQHDPPALPLPRRAQARPSLEAALEWHHKNKGRPRRARGGTHCSRSASDRFGVALYDVKEGAAGAPAGTRRRGRRRGRGARRALRHAREGWRYVAVRGGLLRHWYCAGQDRVRPGMDSGEVLAASARRSRSRSARASRRRTTRRTPSRRGAACRSSPTTTSRSS